MSVIGPNTNMETARDSMKPYRTMFITDAPAPSSSPILGRSDRNMSVVNGGKKHSIMMSAITDPLPRCLCPSMRMMCRNERTI